MKKQFLDLNFVKNNSSDCDTNPFPFLAKLMDKFESMIKSIFISTKKCYKGMCK